MSRCRLENTRKSGDELMNIRRRLRVGTCFTFLNALTSRTCAWNPPRIVKSSSQPCVCCHLVPILYETGGLPYKTTQLRSENLVPVNFCPKRFLLLASLILGFVQFPPATVADAVPTFQSSLIVSQRDISSSENQRKVYHWSFANGDVLLSDETYLAGMVLKHPRLLGSGAGGAVFALQQEPLYSSHREEKNSHEQEVALKVSWKGSSQDVRNECDILKKLQRSASNYDGPIGAVEVCLGEGFYEPDATRTMIALQPVFYDEQVASVSELLPDQSKVQTAVTLIVRTMLQMISANVVTVDVQPLISKNTGDVLFIDFTQAISIYESNEKSTTTDTEAVVIRNFVNEMMLLIPKEQQESTASNLILDELSRYPKQSPYVYDVLLEQNFSQEALEYLAGQRMS